MAPLLSIIIPTHNEERDIFECLLSLSKQSFKNYEVIIVDDGSTDNTLEQIKRFARVKILKQPHFGPGAARNLGAKTACGEILIFIDADMTFEEDYLKKLIKPLLGDEGKAVVGTTHELEIVKNIDSTWSRCWGKIRVSKEDAKNVKVFRAIRKDKFLELGGFDPKYGYADDQTLWFKYRIKSAVAPDTICYHKNPETLGGVYKQSKWIGASVDNFLIKIPVIGCLAPVFLVILSPIAIPFLSIKKLIKNKDWGILFPMFIFMTARYFGNIHGLINLRYLKSNVR